MRKKDIKTENEVYFLGSKESRVPKSNSAKRWIIAGICIAVIATILILIFSSQKQDANYYFEPVSNQTIEKIIPRPVKNDTIKGYVEVLEETVNDVPLLIYIPHNAEMSLSVGRPDKSDSTIIFITQAADIRGDNFEIVGDFVLAGRQLSRGVAKTGFCAIIEGNITIGVTDNTPLLQKAVDSKGYFFRQYPLVSEGELIENNPKNKSIRRALAIRSDKIIIIESRSAESFHDFSQALIDIGVSDAIYLVGTNTAFGWYYDKDHNKTEFGVELTEIPSNTSYIVWLTK